MELSVQEFRGLLTETIARWRSLHKDLRFGQFLSCAIGDRDLFLVEDDEMERLVREKFEEFGFDVRPLLTKEDFERGPRGPSGDARLPLDGLPHDLRGGGSEPKDGNEDE